MSAATPTDPGTLVGLISLRTKAAGTMSFLSILVFSMVIFLGVDVYVFLVKRQPSAADLAAKGIGNVSKVRRVAIQV